MTGPDMNPETNLHDYDEHLDAVPEPLAVHCPKCRRQLHGAVSLGSRCGWPLTTIHDPGPMVYCTGIMAEGEPPPPQGFIFSPTTDEPPLVDLVRELREALGMYAGAMAITPKAAWEQAIQEVLALRERNAGMQAALKEIIDPMAAIQKRADEKGHHVTGMAFQIAESHSYLKDIAKKALASKEDTQWTP